MFKKRKKKPYTEKAIIFAIEYLWLNLLGFPGSSVIKNPPANLGAARATGDAGLIPALGRPPGG